MSPDTKLHTQTFTPLLLALLMRAARALFFEAPLKLGGVGLNDREDRRIFSDLSQNQLYWSTDFTSEQGERVQNHRQKGV
jgi:hypothetical protein